MTTRGWRSTGGLWRRTGLVLALLAAVAVAGCGSSDEVPQQPPKELLLTALPNEEDPPFQLTRKTSGLEMTAQVDAYRKAARVVTTQKRGDVTMTVGVLAVDDRRWVKLSFTGAGAGRQPTFPDKWLALDPAKLTRPLRFEDLGVTTVRGFLKAATTVEDKGRGRYAGTIDVTPDPVRAELGTTVLVQELGDKAKAIPFTATLAPDHHVGTFTLDIPASATRPGFQDVYTFSGFGSTPEIAPPGADETQDAPPEAYRIVNQ